MKCKIGLTLACYLSMVMFFSLSAQKVTDLLSIPSITYNATNYTLKNAYQPNDNHYKQVYFSKNENSHNFSSMVQIEVVFGQDSISNLFRFKLNELEALKKVDNTCDYSYEINNKTGEYFLCYLTSVQKNKKTDMVEWNAYRYKPVSSDNGLIGVMLFSVTKRAYNNKECTAFLEEARNNKSVWMNAISSYSVPAIKPMK